MKKALFIVLSIFSISNSQVRIAGEQDGVFDSASYVVSKDIIVPAEKSLKFLPGSEISFLPYTGMRVYGNLIINGSKLTSLDDHGLWNGIEIAPKGSINFENVIISRSVLGIAAADSTVINALGKIKFIQNKISLKIADKSIFIRDDEPYSFEKAIADRSIQTGNIPSSTVLGMKRTRPSILALRWGTAIAALASTALWAYYLEASENSKTKYNYAATSDEAKYFRSQSDDFRQYGILSGIGAIIFSAGLFISISINGCSK